MKRSLILSSILLTALALDAQQPAPLTVGAAWTGASYTGDLTRDPEGLSRWRPGGELSLYFEKQRPVFLQLNAGFGAFQEQADGSELAAAEQAVPNSYVQTDFFYTDLRLRVRLLHRRSALYPVLSAGAGLLFFTPRDQAGNFLGENFLTRLEDETYSTTVASLPLGAGLRLRISQHATLGAEYTLRLTATDYLDNIGALGLRAGPDQLHSMSMGLYFQIGEPAGLPGAPPEPPLPALFIPESAASVPDGVNHTLRPVPQADSLDRAAREAAAIALGHIRTVRTDVPESIAGLARRWGVEEASIRRLNPKLKDPVPAGQKIVLPDVEF
ncbi:MAG: LysM peptidoglycan-binding domain-containing protein [Bacteroidia bacterium]|nr:LysM peptidoglycan-binding domain-containing protein [Bacteroidia bacterium]